MENPAGTTDADLKRGVLDEFQVNSPVQIADMQVLVTDGVVTLQGHADNLGEKLSAVRAAMRVTGVMAVKDDIQVALPQFAHWKDSEIAMAAANRIAWSTMIPVGAVRVSVHEGRITLEGVLERSCQRQAAEASLQHLAGVTGIRNLITIQPASASPGDGPNIESSGRWQVSRVDPTLDHQLKVDWFWGVAE
jgi:osmotically-inducible protein OsmY